MNSDEREDLVKYKMLRARETLNEIGLLIDNNYLHTAVNRVYYACFYAVSALLISKEIKARKHSGVIQMFALHFIITKIIGEELGKFYTHLFDKRQKGDYEEYIFFTKNEVFGLIGPAEKLINRIGELLVEI